MGGLTGVQPGDVLAVRGGGWTGRMIRLGAALLDRPDLDAHIAVAHHTDAQGVLWCIEGRPGGAGWRDAKAYLASPWTVTNQHQPKTALQRERVCDTMLAMIGKAYDWAAIAADALGAFHLDRVWRPTWKDGTVPGQVVCSSLAAYAYSQAGLDCPTGGREVTPGDWTELIIEKGWQ